MEALHARPEPPARLNKNGGRCRHRPPLVPALTAVAGWRGHLSLGGFGSRSGHESRLALRESRSEASRPRSEPVGSRERLCEPLTDSLGSLGQDRNPAIASLRGSGPAEAAPSPRARIEAEASPVARFERRRAEAFRLPRDFSRPKLLEIPSDRGAARRPCRSPGARPAGRSLLNQPLSGRGWGVSLSPFPCQLDRGAIPAAFAGSARLPAPKSLSAWPWEVS
jgi:hypothetical protein